MNRVGSRGARSPRRQHGALALIAVLLLNLLLGAGAHRPAPAGQIAGAIEICAADGGARVILPDATEPPPAGPAHDGQGCPDCTTCTPACGVGCGMAAGFAVLVPWLDRGALDIRLLAASARLAPETPFTLRPPGQAPPSSAA